MISNTDKAVDRSLYGLTRKQSRTSLTCGYLRSVQQTFRRCDLLKLPRRIGGQSSDNPARAIQRRIHMNPDWGCIGKSFHVGVLRLDHSTVLIEREGSVAMDFLAHIRTCWIPV